ncbi:hepatocyte growth factor-like [Nematolebias whitei]|uniref:hepatocyte growth factor-like n=1 Tax=Nematolebias whitei TaxID=451745 RepID=UPI0018992769|nr:hepatocyte growth factor-like [Nematolebias whitei]
MRTNVWIYQTLLCVLVEVLDTGCCQKPRRQFLQKYEKTESHVLVCTDCPLTPLVQRSRSQEHCARKCMKLKKKFSCRAFNFQRHNRKCHLLPFDRFTHGVQKQANINFTLYEKKDYIRECIADTKDNYRGRRSWTKSNITCQAWSDNNINEHTNLLMSFRGNGFKRKGKRHRKTQTGSGVVSMEENMADDSDTSEDFDVNATMSCVQGEGTNYRGTMNVTPEGVTCQRWDSQFPHNHSFLPQNFKCKDLQENYCRNPDGADYPWCFTTDPNLRIAKCTHISRCDAEDTQKIECYEDIGETYWGSLSITRSGIPCANWSHHINSEDSHSTVSHVGLEINYCRNPDRDKHGPWCYTSPNNRLVWDYCKLKQCESATTTPQPNHPARPKISCFVHINTRIVGGHQVRGTDGSWVVSIQRENVHLCGGSLIREDWVLTDQQCFTSCVPDLKDYSVQAGLRHLNESSRRPRLRISHLICGPEGSNLVMLKLVDPAPVSEGASTIHLPVKECHIAEGTNCTMYGWGETKNTGHDEALNTVTMPMVNNDICSQIKGDTGDSRICAGGRIGEGVCDRDYGGPLVCQEHERKVIIGVSIQRTKCASSQPALFVNVAFYSEWIYKVFKLYPTLERK